MKSLILAIQFLTRIPIKSSNLQVTDEDFGKSQRAFILVAFLLGGLLSLLYYLLENRLPTIVLGFLILATEVLISGGLLLDGFMDSCDGLFSSRPRERSMEIMRDSRVGAHSVTFVILLFLSKFAVYSSLDLMSDPYLILFFGPVAGLWFLLFVINYFPYAREEGVGKFFKDQARFKDFFLNTILVFLALLLFSNPSLVLLGFMGTFFLTSVLAFRVNKFLLGHTGDTYGAMAQTAQAIYILIMTFLLF